MSGIFGRWGRSKHSTDISHASGESGAATSAPPATATPPTPAAADAAHAMSAAPVADATPPHGMPSAPVADATPVGAMPSAPVQPRASAADPTDHHQIEAAPITGPMGIDPDIVRMVTLDVDPSTGIETFEAVTASADPATGANILDVVDITTDPSTGATLVERYEAASIPGTPDAPPAAPSMPPMTGGSFPASGAPFASTMMDFQLTLQHTISRAQLLFPHREVVTNTESGPVRTTYGAVMKRVNQLAGALARLGVGQGDRIGTLGWNTAAHLEAYFAIPCMGAVLHTLNLRLSPQDLAYIINDASDSLILVDSDLVPLLARIADQLTPVRALIVMNGTAQVPEGVSLPPILSYEDLLAGESASYPWPELDERQAAAMCYTSGTTGNPKGVVYSHRSIMLHSLTGGLPDVLDVSERDVVMPFVPMFHANAWGLAHSAPMFGATLVFPGRLMDPVNVTKLIANEHVTLAAGVPTIWIGMLQLVSKDPTAYDLSALQRIICGGSAVPLALIEGLQAMNLNIIQAWGMTEMSPLGSVARVRAEYANLPVADQNVKARAKAGVAAPLVEFRVVDDAGQQVPWDGKTFGELQVRGPWITASYYHGGADNINKFADGWLRTGDVVTLDENGYIGIVDRTKDVIKSGGEWISSVDLENMIMGHPQVLEAAVIGVPDPKWQERPVAYVVPKPEFVGVLTAEDIIAYLTPRVAKFWLPDEIIFIDAVPKTSVGKFDKKVLRGRHAADHPAQ